MTEPVYVIGDIHGQLAALDHALSLIEADGGTDANVVFLGDYTDRGPDSKGVLDRLISGVKAGRKWTCIKGNHDRFFSHWILHGREHDPRVKSGISWLNHRLGGDKTLASYGVRSRSEAVFERRDDGLEYLVSFSDESGVLSAADVRKQAQSAVPAEHLEFLENLPLLHQTDALLFVHAGLRPGVPLDRQDVEDLLWIRDPWLEDRRDHGKLVVHGHTALDQPEHYGNRVNLDGGAGYGNPIIPAVFEGRDCWLLAQNGREPLRP